MTVYCTHVTNMNIKLTLVLFESKGINNLSIFSDLFSKSTLMKTNKQKCINHSFTIFQDKRHIT